MYIQFAEKLQEFKEAARLAKEKSQEKMELTSTPSQVSFTASFKASISKSARTVLRTCILQVHVPLEKRTGYFPVSLNPFNSQL